MEAYKQEFIEFMVDCGVLKFGDFVTKSGRKTPFFVNTGFYRTGAQLRKLGEYYAKAIESKFGLTTAGTSIQETLPIIKAQGDVNPIGLVVSVDRMERGQGTKSALKEIEETYGLKTTAIVTMAEVVEHLYNKEYKGKVVIDDTLKAAIDAYYEQYGAENE